MFTRGLRWDYQRLLFSSAGNARRVNSDARVCSPGVGAGLNVGVNSGLDNKGSAGSHPGTAASCRGAADDVACLPTPPSHRSGCLFGLEPSHTPPPPHLNAKPLSFSSPFSPLLNLTVHALDGLFLVFFSFVDVFFSTLHAYMCGGFEGLFAVLQSSTFHLNDAVLHSALPSCALLLGLLLRLFRSSTRFLVKLLRVCKNPIKSW